jgi:hypothetical protein
MDEILVRINKRFDEIDQCFDKLNAYIDKLKWVIGLELFTLGGILVLIVKVFFFGPLD